MSSKIDERIVGMKFQGDQFQKGVADTNKALEKLKQGLNLGGAAKGMKDLDATAKNFSLAGLANGVQNIASKFGALSIVGITALANIANRAVDAGIRIAKSLTIDPVKAGFAEYELKMGSIQTMLANTERYGTTLKEVTSSLDELNHYADKTIYNFGDMTKNIGLFTNAGIRIEEATSMIQGFSNVAAASGTSAAGAAGAAYQLSQALSAGTIRLMDWRSLTNVGMGNKNMQNGLIEIADAMGVLNKTGTSATEIQSNFNASLEKNWLSADVMSNYLQIMAGKMTDAEMAALGLSKAQVAAFRKSAQTAEDAATKVRTFTQLLGTMQEGVGSGWAQTFDILIGDFNEATDLWTAVNDELGVIIGDMSDARNKLLTRFVELGGRDMVLGAFANIWQAFKMYIMPIKSAFEEIFPPTTAHDLMAIVRAFSKFAESLKPSAETMKLLRRTFMGVFAVFDIGWMILKQIIGLFSRLFGTVAQGSGGILEITANIGDFLVRVRDAIKSGDGLNKVFEILGNILVKPINLLKKLGGFIVNLFDIESFREAWEGVARALKAVWEFLKPVVDWFVATFNTVKDAVKKAFAAMDFNLLVGALNVGLLASIILMVKSFLGRIKKMLGGKGMNLFQPIKDIFSELTETMQAMQTKLKAEALIKVAIAIALLTASVVALSFIDTGKLFIALGAMTVMFGQLSAMLLAIDKLTKTVGTTKMVGVAVALGLLAGGMILMSTAILIMSTMDWAELARGLTGLAVGLGVLVGATMLLDKVKFSMAQSAGAIFVFASAMLVLSAALKIMSTMSWDDIFRSASVMAASIGIMIGAGYLAQKGIKGVGSMLVLAGVLTIISGALKVFSTMSWDDIFRSMAVMAAAVGILVGAVAILSVLKMAPVGAATMIAMAVAVTILTGALKIFASFSVEEIIRSLVMLAGSLTILAAAMAIMGVPMVALGGLALFVVSAGLMMLAPALALLGTMSWDAIGRGLAMLGASLAILAVGGVLLIPASIGFMLLGTAIMLLGTGAMMAGTGMMMFAAGFIALAGAAALGSEAIKMAVMTMIGLIPMAMAAFAQGIIDFALVIAGGATEFTAAMVTLITALMNAINETAPLVIETIWNLIVMLVAKVVEGVPMFVDAGMKLLIGIINGIGNNIRSLTDAAINLVTEFVGALGSKSNVNKILKAGGDLVYNWINGIGDYIRNNTNRFVSAGSRLFRAVVDGIATAIERGGADIRYAGERIGNALWQGAMNALGINSPSKVFRDKIMGGVFEGIEKGNQKNISRAGRAGSAIGDAMVNTAAKSLDKIRDAVATDLSLDPVIKPVLDLSAVRKDSSLIGGMLTPPSLKVTDSYAYASSIASERRATEEAIIIEKDDEPPREGDTYIFQQTNNSPKALPEAEIYRQTNNLISTIKKGKPSA